MKLCTASSCPSATALAGRPRFCFSSGAQPSVRQQPRPRHTSASWNDLAGPEHAALLVTTVRAAILPVVHHYLPRAAARLLSMCAKAVRFPAGAWPPHHGRAALPRPGQARPGLLRLLPAGGGHRMTCRAGLRGFLRGGTSSQGPLASGVQESSGPSVRAAAAVQKRSGPTVRKKKAVSSVQPSSAELSALGLGESPWEQRIEHEAGPRHARSPSKLRSSR